MDIVSRAKNICLTPNTEWAVIDGETTPTATLITGYVIPMAAIGAIAGFIGRTIIGYPFIGRVSMMSGLVGAIFTIVFAIVGVFVVSLIIDALAPTFNAQKNSLQAFKVAAYSFTPAWIAAVLNIIPMLGVLAIIGALYSIYLLYLGLPRLMKAPQEKAVPYTLVVIVCGIVVGFVLSAMMAVIGLAGMGFGYGRYGGGLGGMTPDSEIVYDKDSTLGKLQEFGKKMEESGKKMEEAEKRGDHAAQVGAAMEGLGALFGGGKHVEPVNIAQLKPFVPESFASLPRLRSSAEKTGMGPIMVSKAEATYGNNADREVTLEVTDTGGVSGLIGLAGWMGMQEEKETEDGYERTNKVGNRLVHEKTSKNGTNEFGIVLGDRFLVSARGRGVGLSELKSAVSGLELAKLESMKDLGVNK
jgi:hypothetical protein